MRFDLPDGCEPECVIVRDGHARHHVPVIDPPLHRGETLPASVAAPEMIRKNLREICESASHLSRLAEQLHGHLRGVMIVGENGASAHVARLADQLKRDIHAVALIGWSVDEAPAPVAAKESFDFGVGCELDSYEAAIALVIGQLVMCASEMPELHAAMFRKVVDCLRKYGQQQARLAIHRTES